MKDKLFTAMTVCFLSVFVLLTGTVPVLAVNDHNTVNDVRDVVDGIVNWNLNQTGSTSIQEWIDGALTENAGMTSEWYILALRQSGNYDFSSYEEALTNYLQNNTIRSASSRLKYALVLHAIGSTNDDITAALNDSIGEQGIMSWIYGLHIMNNGYICETYTTADVLTTLLSLQHEDGGWSITGEYGDVDVTAMAVQALALHYDTDSVVKTAVDNALTLLSSRQQDDGGYASYGVNNPESAAQVLVALSSLGIDCVSDERFIKNEKTLFDGITKYQLEDGSFCHKEGEKSNDTATVQAFYSMVSYIRMTEGSSPLYIFTSDVIEEAIEPANPDTELALEDTPSDFETTVPVLPSEPVEFETEEPVPVETSPEEPAAVADTAEASVTMRYKPWACLIVVAIGGAACLIFFLRGKRHIKNFIAIAVLTGLAVVIVMVTDFQSADDYYSGESIEKENALGTVTLTIRCDTIVGKSDSEYIPADGIILDVTEFAIAEGDSVFDILTEAAQRYHIQMENSGRWNMVYISGINYLYEFDFGDLSGWIYYVNGVAPSVGCGEYILSDGDEIEWLYTCDLGNDLN